MIWIRRTCLSGIFMDPRFLILAVGMIITGSLNSISNKYADLTFAVGIDGLNKQFNHPYVQTLAMFLGESLCMAAFYSMIAAKKLSKTPTEVTPRFNPLIFVLPALCDMTATSLMNWGLTLTYVSVFQMLRGAVIIFTGILSHFFLNRLKLYHWVGMVLVIIGLGIVGLSSVLFGQKDSSAAPNPLLGDIIIVCAQFIVAIQMVVEEKFIDKYNVPPLKVVGFEGLFGFSILSIVLVIFYFIPGNSAGNHLENTPDALVQIGNSWILGLSIGGNVLSIAFFNFFGISMTKYASASTRMVIDSIRTITIWIFGLIFLGEKFQWLQPIGFFFLITGTLLFREVIRIPFLGVPDKNQSINDESKKSLLGDEDPVVNNP